MDEVQSISERGWRDRQSCDSAPWVHKARAMTREEFKREAGSLSSTLQGFLKRDSCRCRWSSGMEDLQVHHILPRSRLGDDVAENLITLCASCHQKAHRQLGRS